MKAIVDVLALLKAQHDEIDDLFDELDSTTGDRRALFAQVADKLAAHATAEERVFYPSVMTKMTDEVLHDAVEEHLAIKRMLAEMLELDPVTDAEEFDTKLFALKKEITFHARAEEEAKLFPLVRREFDAEQLAALGEDVLAMFEEVITQEPRFDVVDETAEAAPLPAP
jgi:hemerythrin superfamily protein